MKILQVPILCCFRCGLSFTPKINADEQSISIPKACPTRHCRAQTWNIPDSELAMIKEKQKENLAKSPYQQKNHSSKQLIKMTKLQVLNKYKPKKKEKVPTVMCEECEIFFHDEESLKRHQHRRHHGMCSVCHCSNVYVMKRNKMNICKTCFESKT